MANHEAVLAVRRMRPRKTVTIGTEKFTLRQPMLNALRAFQNRGEGEESQSKALQALFQECICDTNGDAFLDDDDALELVHSTWFVGPCLQEILRFSQPQLPPDEPLPGEASAGAAPANTSQASDAEAETEKKD